MCAGEHPLTLREARALLTSAPVTLKVPMEDADEYDDYRSKASKGEWAVYICREIKRKKRGKGKGKGGEEFPRHLERERILRFIIPSTQVETEQSHDTK
jgi:hypothetical protein